MKPNVSSFLESGENEKKVDSPRKGISKAKQKEEEKATGRSPRNRRKDDDRSAKKKEKDEEKMAKKKDKDDERLSSPRGPPGTSLKTGFIQGATYLLAAFRCITR